MTVPKDCHSSVGKTDDTVVDFRKKVDALLEQHLADDLGQQNEDELNKTKFVASCHSLDIQNHIAISGVSFVIAVAMSIWPRLCIDEKLKQIQLLGRKTGGLNA